MPSRIAWSIFIVLILAAAVDAQTPPRLEELPRLAKTWPRSWATLAGDLDRKRADFSRDSLKKINALLQAEPATRETYPIAETVLAAVLRHQLSLQRNAPLTTDAGQAITIELQDSLARMRADWLNFLRSNNHLDDANRLADAWLPASTTRGPVRDAIVKLWMDQASAAIKNAEYQVARGWLDRAEAAMLFDPSTEAIQKLLQERAESLLKEALNLPKTEGTRQLQDALAIWPRLPGARDELARRNGAFRSLVIGIPNLPEQMSPAKAWTFTEKQTLDLLFDRLCHVDRDESGKHYRSSVAEILPRGDTGLVRLRQDIFWSNGERMTAADVRHTAVLMNRTEGIGRTRLWRQYLDGPTQHENPFVLNIGYRQGLLDPLAPLTFHILPQYYRKKQLSSADNPDFAKSPIGTGPFQYIGRKVEDGKIFAVFATNPHDLRGEPRAIREVRMMAWSDPSKDLVKPLPELIVDAPTNHLPALRKLGYVQIRSIGKNPGVSFLAVNHRRPGLAGAPLRRAMAQAIDRKALLDRNFRSEDSKGEPHATVNGPFPRKSWAICPAPRVPDELFQLEAARSSLRQVAKDVKASWTLKFPAGDERIRAACEEIARTVQALLAEAGIKASVQPMSIPPHALQKALYEHDYDLLYVQEENLDDPVRLSLFFDTAPEATRSGGANYLGYEGDIKLQELLRATLKHRQFSVAQANMHAVHAHLNESMPLIPLWQLDVHILAQPTLRLPDRMTGEIFTYLRDWKPNP